MSKWRDPDAWAALCRPSGCPICTPGVPRDVLAPLASCWVTMPEDAPMRGYVCVVSRVHAVELHDLSATEGAAFMRDLQTVARAVAQRTRAVKLNYEIHGNTIPHLHMHIFPRYPGDPFERGPIDPRAVTGPVYAAGEFQALGDALKSDLASPAA